MRSLLDKYMSSVAYGPEAGAGSGEVGTPVPDVSGGSEPSLEGDFDSFGSVDDFDSVDLETGADPSPEPTATPAVEVPPVVPPTATPPVAPEVPPAAPPVAAVPPPKGPDSPSSGVDNLVQNLETNAPALVDWLTQNAFALTKDEADAFEMDAVGQIPKMMAKVQVASMKATLGLIKTLIPGMIDAQTAQSSGKQAKAKEAISEFYSANSDLNEKDHGALVTKWANAFRAQNPSAPRADAIKFVGAAIRTELGMGPLVASPVKAVPFAPARPGARQPIPTQIVESPFAGLGMDLEE